LTIPSLLTVTGTVGSAIIADVVIKRGIAARMLRPENSDIRSWIPGRYMKCEEESPAFFAGAG
jgi:hypothetical protein